jgi:hypothetical protein
MVQLASQFTAPVGGGGSSISTAGGDKNGNGEPKAFAIAADQPARDHLVN